MKPETVEDVLEREGGWDDTVRVLEDMGGGWLLDATVYRSCPECGGSGTVQEPGEYGGPDGEPVAPRHACPACAGSPTAIMEVALRERAATDACDAFNEMATEDTVSGEALWNAVVDAVLSIVLPRVRWAKEVGVLQVPAGARLESGKAIEGCWCMKWDEYGPLPREVVCGEARADGSDRSGALIAVLEEEPHGSKENTDA